MSGLRQCQADGVLTGSVLYPVGECGEVLIRDRKFSERCEVTLGLLDVEQCFVACGRVDIGCVRDRLCESRVCTVLVLLCTIEVTGCGLDGGKQDTHSQDGFPSGPKAVVRLGAIRGQPLRRGTTVLAGGIEVCGVSVLLEAGVEGVGGNLGQRSLVNRLRSLNSSLFLVDVPLGEREGFFGACALGFCVV